MLERYRAALNALGADLSTSDANDARHPSDDPRGHATMNPSRSFPPSRRRRALLAAGGASLLLGAAGCATRPAAPAVARRLALAPTGRLRASINLGNPVLARRDATTGAVAGVSVDLARALADEIAVPLELVVVDGAARSVEAVKSGQADVGFFAIDPVRSEGIRFTAPYVLIEGAYLVRNGSPLTPTTRSTAPARASSSAAAAPTTST